MTIHPPTPAALHELKCWPEYFGPVLSGAKTFEVRRHDRDFHLGDILRLQEWSPVTRLYSGREISVVVTYLMHDMGLAAGYVAMAIHPLAPTIKE